MPQSVKPSRAQLNRAHPLSQQARIVLPFTEGSGSVRDLAGSGDLQLALEGTASWSINRDRGLLCDAPGEQASASLPNRCRPTAAVSIMWRGVVLGDGTIDNYPTLFGGTYGPGDPYHCWSICRTSGGQPHITVVWNNGSLQLNIVSNVITYGEVVTFVLSLGTSAGAVLFKNGVSVGSWAFSGSISYSASSRVIVCGHDNVTNQNANAITHFAAMWARETTAAQAMALHVDPYAILRARRRRPTPKKPSSGTTAIATTQATETDTALAATVSTALTTATGQATETESALAPTVTAAISVATTQTSETDSARAASAVLATAIATTQATETDTALAATVSTALTTATGQATETESALAPTVTAAAAIATGQTTETDEARAATVAAAVTVTTGQTAETDSARAATVAAAFVGATGRATETDEALPLLQAQAVACGRAEETDEARGCEVTQAGGQSTGGAYWLAPPRARRRADERRPRSAVRPAVLAAIALAIAEEEDYGL